MRVITEAGGWLAARCRVIPCCPAGRTAASVRPSSAFAVGSTDHPWRSRRQRSALARRTREHDPLGEGEKAVSSATSSNSANRAREEIVLISCLCPCGNGHVRSFSVRFHYDDLVQTPIAISAAQGVARRIGVRSSYGRYFPGLRRRIGCHRYAGPGLISRAFLFGHVRETAERALWTHPINMRYRQLTNGIYP